MQGILSKMSNACLELRLEETLIHCMAMTKFGIFNQPASPTKSSSKNTANNGPKMGCGDYYGTGVKNPIGKLRSDTMGYRPVSRKQMGTPPTSVV